MKLSPGFFTLLKVLIFVAMLAGNIVFFMTSVLPYWNRYEAISQTVSDTQVEVTLRDAQIQASAANAVSIAQAQVQNAAIERSNAAVMFLTRAQAENLLDVLYEIAGRTNTTITSIQAQQPAQPSNSEVVEVNSYAINVQGPFRYLLYFVSMLRQAASPVVSMRNLSIQGDESNAVLTMTLYTYQSVFANGQAFDPIVYTPPTLEPTPTLFLPTWTPSPTATITPTSTPSATSTHTATLTETPSATQTITLTNTPEITLTQTEFPTLNVSIAPEAIPTADQCDGAPPIRLQVGVRVVVDFNQSGALRVMSWITEGAADTLVQAYDNDTMAILAGPVCGQWNGAPVWYWYVDFQGTRGWAAEGTATERWLCPLDQPECA